MRDDILKKEPFDAQPAEPTDWEALRTMRDEDIDTSDIPVVVYEELPLPGTMLKPVKRQVTMRLDVAVINWFKAHTTDSYQAYINRVLRHFIWQQTGVFPTRPSISVPVRGGRNRQGAPELQAAGIAESAASYAPTGHERAPCACGCGEFPKGEGSVYLPGHDTRMYRIQDLIHTMAQSDSQWLQGIAQSHKDRVAARERGGPCVCGCGETPSGKRSRFIIGHDARYRGFLLAELRVEEVQGSRVIVEGSIMQVPERNIFTSDEYMKVAARYTSIVKAHRRGDPCACGCGDYPKGESRQFASGHDMKLKGRLLSEIRSGG